MTANEMTTLLLKYLEEDKDLRSHPKYAVAKEKALKIAVGNNKEEIIGKIMNCLEKCKLANDGVSFVACFEAYLELIDRLYGNFKN